jgi:outer membrane receptor protein involved in Fe transport
MYSKAKFFFSYFTLSVALLSFPVSLFAQTGIIRGKITDAKTNEALIGASVTLAGTSTVVIADLEGNYIIKNVKPGKQSLSFSYVGYLAKTQAGIITENGKETVVNVALEPDSYTFKEVEVVAKSNRESENILLLEQKRALLATQTVGAKELSRKGISNAEAAVAQVSGVSKQEGVKNVFVRGLGDRYNATMLNGFPIPSEEPEYKNISLDFFGSDMIQNIGVRKSFASNSYGDAGGAIIDISSKELFGDQAFGAEVSGGVNTKVAGADFLHQSGSNFLGFANSDKPAAGTFGFHNNLDPSVVSMPFNQGVDLSGGKLFHLGEGRRPLSFFVVASHSSEYSYTQQTIRGITSVGTIYLDQTGDKYTESISQVVLANAKYEFARGRDLSYNFMMLHANNQYVGDYYGVNGEKYQGAVDDSGFMRRQQTNDNMLFVHQITSNWKLTNNVQLSAGGSFNSIKGLEPDRRENNFSKQTSGYSFTGSNRQKRFFSELEEKDYNVKTALKYKLGDSFGSENSALILGYDGRFVDDKFNAVEYNTGINSSWMVSSIDDLKLDDYYNPANFASGDFSVTRGYQNKYHVSKKINSVYGQGTYQLSSKLTANAGLRFDRVDLNVDYEIEILPKGEAPISRNYFLPSLNLKYDLNDKNVLRLGLSKTYTLPQSKEISPYQYVNIDFVSQGNPNLKPSDNYNLDLKWDNYLSASELFSLTAFVKHIAKPIGRVDQGNSAGLLTYANISSSASVAGVELEMRKNLFSKSNANSSASSKLSLGVNASYIYTNLKVKIENTLERNSRLEGAAPFISNVDLSYNLRRKEKDLFASVVFNYFSDRIHTIGTKAYKDIIEKGVPTLDFVSGYKLNKHLGIKLKATNILNPSYRLVRDISGSNSSVTLNDYKKGMNVSMGISYEL